MKVDPDTGWLAEARIVPSPNHDERPAGCAVDAVIVHAISLPPGDFGGRWIERFFCNALNPDAHPYFAEIRDLRVSAHALIDRQGEITQFVPFDRRAWHAGRSSLDGRSECNDFAVGIELEGCDDRPFEPVQYERLAQVIRALMRRYPAIASDRVTGHSDVAPGRKTDPGPHFDWQRLRELMDVEPPT